MPVHRGRWHSCEIYMHRPQGPAATGMAIGEDEHFVYDFMYVQYKHKLMFSCPCFPIPNTYVIFQSERMSS